jgi:hypothetical protein
MKAAKKGETGCGSSEFQRGMAVLQGEIALVEKIASVQISVRNAVISREWTNFEMLFNKLGELSKEFEALESERIEIFMKIAEKYGTRDESAGFYTLISRLPQDERKEAAGLYRRLKMETFKTRLANDTLMVYLNEAKATVEAFLEAAFPDRKGRLYSRQGIERMADMRSMVLDRCF